MEGRHTLKVAGGKLLKIRINVDGEKIKDVEINGDFFAHPEEAIERIEDAIKGCGKKDVGDRIRETISETGAILYGIDAESITKAISEAWDGMQAA
ncbi:MAG: lipoate protein ligase C-terminal domain-containing protein [Candidatus Altiarchaeota archaeon]